MVDWQQVRQRLLDTQRAFETSLDPSPERLEEVYRRRAARLALRPAAEAPAATTIPVLIFRLGSERYGMPVEQLAAVIANPVCPPVPTGPPRLAGVINVRGEIRPVWDLAGLLELPQREPAAGRYVLLLRSSAGEVGVQVDRVEQVRTLDSKEWNAPGERFPYVQGITADAVLVLDSQQVLKELRR